MGESHLAHGGLVAGESQNRPIQRAYPGGHSMGKSNVNAVCIAPPSPEFKIPTKIGEENLSKSLEPPAFEEARIKTKMLQDNLRQGLEAPQFCHLVKVTTKMCEESEPEVVHSTPVVTKWLQNEMAQPLPQPPARREFPHGQAFGSRSKGEEIQPLKIKVVYPSGQQV